MTKNNLCNEVLENAIGVHRSFEKIEPLEIMDAVAVQAMEELLEYRAIGTVDDYWKLNEICKEYSAIGTIEEFKDLKENQRKCEDCAGCTNWKCDCANIREQAITEFYDKVLNFEDYIEPKGTSEFGAVLLYSGKDITNMIVKIAEEMRGAE